MLARQEDHVNHLCVAYLAEITVNAERLEARWHQDGHGRSIEELIADIAEHHQLVIYLFLSGVDFLLLGLESSLLSQQSILLVIL